MGSTGDPPVPVGDPPTGTSKGALRNRPWSLVGDILSIPSGESPDGTGQWPVLPETQFPNTLSGRPPCAGGGRKATRRSQRDHSNYEVQTPTGCHAVLNSTVSRIQ